MQRLPPTKTPCFVSYPFLESIVNNPCEDKNLSSLRGGGLQSSSLCLDEINLDEVTKGNSTANGGEKDQGSVSQNAPLKPSLQRSKFAFREWNWKPEYYGDFWR